MLACRYEQLEEMVTDALYIARELGASNTVTKTSEGQGLLVTIREGEVEIIEQNRDKAVGATVMLSKRRGDANTPDFSPAVLRFTVEAAYDAAWFTAGDDRAGLAKEELLEKYLQDLQLYHLRMIDVETVVGTIRAAEAAVFVMSPKIRNNDGSSISAQHSRLVLVTSRGFMGSYPYSRHLISAIPIAGSGAHTQRDDRCSSKRSPGGLVTPEAIGKYAAERMLVRLDVRRLTMRKCPVLFKAPLTAGLLSVFVQAVSGGALYHRSTFLLGTLGKKVLAPHMRITEDPHILNGISNASLDEGGVRTQRRDVMKNGVVEGYFLSTCSARRLGMQAIGNVGGSHNLTLFSDRTTAEDDFVGTLRRMGTGLLMTELMGQGVNYAMSDYSRDALGYWAENDVIQYPVEEITITDNLREMFRRIIAIGVDALVRGTRETGSVLVEQVTTASG